MRILLIALLCMEAALATAQVPPTGIHVAVPCLCGKEDVQVIQGPLPKGSIFVHYETLAKTAKRRTAADVSDRELARMKRIARRMGTCEVVVVDDYRTPSSLVNPDPTWEVHMKNMIAFYMVQHSRPCPECPTTQR